MRSRIYLDNNASTPLDPRVLKDVIVNLKESIGNSFGAHSFGQEVRQRISKARCTIADFLCVKPQEIVFTSGGTEGLNMVIRGFGMGVNRAKTPGHIITSDVEHAAVYNTIKYLESLGYEISYLPAGLWGAVTPDAVQKALRPDTRLIVLMGANNETGVRTDIHGVAQIAESTNIPFVVDGVAMLGKEVFTMPSGVSAMCFSGHKIYAPKGIGVAFIRNNFKLTPLQLGGPQENLRRAGTENVSGIVGFATAISLLKEELLFVTREMERLRDRFEEGIKSLVPYMIINGRGPRICNTSNISFSGIDGESLLINLDREGVAASHGSACISGALEPSRVLLNMGIPLAQARSTIRFSLSRFTTEQEIDHCIEIVARVVTRLAKMYTAER